MSTKKYASAISFLIIIATIYFSYSSLMPTKISNAKTPLTEFSTERALVHLKEITKKPHYTGSIEHRNVQNYIVKQLEQLGLKTEIQQQMAVSEKFRVSTVTQNILARIEGTDSGKALLILSHYDSAPNASLGASDAGSGVVTILESIRAFLAANKQPKNDIIILISDAEEIGLLGAKAFVNNHRWAKDVGMVLNFEARGSGGPSYLLMETNDGNKNLIKNFSKANPNYPVATSLVYSIYKMLPNDTDLTIFREDGDIEGFNFAFIGDHFDYHTAQDSYKRLDKNSLEHQGTYLMPLLNHFADADLTKLKSDTDYIYFNFPIIGMVYYSFSLIYPLLIITILLFIGLLLYGISQHKINPKQFFLASIPLFLSLLISGLLAFYGWKLLLKIHPEYNDILQGFTYNGYLYIAAFSSLTLAISLLIYNHYFKKINAADLIIAPLFIWILINIAIAVYLKGAGYFIIAALYGITSLAILLRSKKHFQNHQVVLSLISIPVLLLFAPMIKMLPVALGLKTLMLSTTFIVLLFGLLLPIFSGYKNAKKLGLLFLVLSIFIFISASFKANYNEDKKQPNSINYVFDADKNEAYWTSYNNNVDDFTYQFLGDDPSQGGFDSITQSSKYGTKIKLHTKTKVKNIPQPVIDIISDTIINNDRILHFTIAPQRKINKIELLANNDIKIKTLRVGDVDIKKKDGSDFALTTGKRKQILSHYFIGDDESLELKFSVSKDEKIALTMYEISFDLIESSLFNVEPLYHVKPRSKTMMPTPFVTNDAVILKKQLNF